MEAVAEPAAESVTEFDIANAMAEGKLLSPQKFQNISLYKMRITGTGVALRKGNGDDVPDEWVMRDPLKYLNERFLDRCQGLPVIWEHPEDKLLDSDEYRQRVVGNIVCPYIVDALQEVWGIAKIYDDDAVTLLDNQRMSTSPTVVFEEGSNESIALEDGSVLLLEGTPAYIDHLAVCEAGVWDKGADPYGVLSETAG